MFQYSLAQVLQFPSVRQAEPKVLAGAKYLDRKIRWVHISDSPDADFLLRGGELLLATGAGLSDDAESQRTYIRRLAEAGAAGVAFDFHPVERSCPEQLVKSAEECQLPLIEFGHPAYFVRITQEVHESITQHQYSQLKQSEDVSRGLFEMLSRGSTAHQILARIADIVGNPVVLEDPAHQLIDFAPESFASHDLLREWERHSRSELGDQGPWPSELSTAEHADCFWQAIAAGGERWGRLHVLAINRPLDPVDAQTVDRASAAIGLTFAATREARFLSHDAQSALMREIELGNFDSASAVRSRARAMGADLDEGPLRVMAIRPSGWDVSSGTTDRSVVEATRLLHGVLDLARESARGAEVQMLAAVQSEHVLVVVTSAESSTTEQTIRALTQNLSSRANARYPGLVLAFGVSGEFILDRPHRGFQEARDAMRWAALNLGRSNLVFSEDLGVERVMLKLSEGPDLAVMVERSLRPLLEYESRTGMPLITTLRAYVAANGRVSMAARELFVERRTVYNRISRIEQLLGLSLEDPEALTRLYLALRGLDFLRATRAIT